MDRRTVLASTGIAFSTAVAGCSELEDEPEEEDGDDLEKQEDDHSQNDSGSLDEDDGLDGNDSTDDTDQDQDDEEEEYEIQEEENQEQEGQDQDQEEEQENTEDDEDDKSEERPEVILPEEGEEHLDVLSHELESSGDGCEFYVELERISSDDEYHVSFDTEVTLYSDDGETIAEKSGPSVSRDGLSEDESRFYTVSFDDCDGVDQYTFEVVNFNVILSADAMEADVEIHSELEDKLDVSHGFSWVDEPGSGQCRINIGAQNTTEDSVISATVNSDNLDSGFTNLEPSEGDEKEIEGSCTEDIERYLVRIGTSDYEIEEAELVNDHNEEIDAEGEAILPEEAEEHLEVRDHALVWHDADQTECEVRVELKKTSADKYHIEFRSNTDVYSADGEHITENTFLTSDGREQLEEGESRIYSSLMIPEGIEEAAEYIIELVRFDAYVHVDELETDFDLDSKLEGKLEVTDSSISFGSGDYVPLDDSKYADRYATVENVTEDYRLTVRGPDGEYRKKTVDLEPGETADFAYTGWRKSVSVDDLTYGFSIHAENVEEIDDS